MRAKRNLISRVVSRLVVTLLLTVGLNAGLGELNDSANAAATLVTDDGSNSSGWTPSGYYDANYPYRSSTQGNPGYAFAFNKNTNISKSFGETGADFSGSKIKFQVRFTGIDQFGIYWGAGTGGGSGITNSLWIGTGQNPASNDRLSGKGGITTNVSAPNLYWHEVDGGISGTGSANVTGGVWEANRWYEIELQIGQTSTSYYIDGVLIQTKATALPTQNKVTMGLDDRNGYNFFNGVYVDNISLTPAIPPKEITYNYNGATGSNSVVSQTYFDTDISLPTPLKSNFTFDGWFESDSFTGSALGTTYSSSVSRTLHAKWTTTQYSVTFDSQRGSAVSNGTFTYTDSAQRPNDPTRYGYRFMGWSETSSGPLKTFPYLPTVLENKILYAQWQQKSLVGVNTGQLVNPTVITPNGTDQTLISTRAASGNVARTRTIINYYDGALPSSYDVSVYTLPDNSFATEQLGSDKSYIISQVVAWKDRVNGDVTDTVVRKEIEMTIESSEIKSGAKVYAIVDGVSTLLATATVDGSVTVKFATDPVIVVAAAPLAPASSPSSGGAGGSISSPVPTSTPLPVLTFAKSFNVLGFNPGSWTLTKSIKKSIDAFFKSINKPSKISCVGYTTGPTILRVDYNLAMRRGQEVCNYVVARNPSIAKMTTKGTTTKISDGKYRRTTINWTE